MKTLPRCSLSLLVIVGALLAAGCLGGTAPTRFYVLPAVEGPAVSGERAVSVGVGPIGLAGYLDRPQIVTRPTADKIDLGEFDQWGEPLRAGISRTLAENLSRQMPSAKITTFPWRGLESVRYQVVVDVTRFDGPTGGDVALEARWRVLDGIGKELASKTTRLAEPSGGAGYPLTVASMSRALGALSREIAQTLAGLPQ